MNGASSLGAAPGRLGGGAQQVVVAEPGTRIATCTMHVANAMTHGRYAADDGQNGLLLGARQGA